MKLPAALLIALVLAAAPAAAQELPEVPGLTAPAEATTGSVPEPEPAPIELESRDPEISRRLSGIYSDLEAFEDVQASVRGGVVTLTGSTLTAADREKAVGIARRLSGVVEVNNEIVVEHRVDRRLEPLVERLNELSAATLAFLPLLLVALAVFVGFWLVGSFLTRSTRLFRRFAPNAFIENLIEQAIRLVFILIGLVAAMNILGATAVLGSILGAAGLLGLAIGFAVRDTIENYIASILLSLRQPFQPEDHVLIEGYEGKITLLNSRATVITTLDGNEVRIPNATVYKANIVNFTRSPERRFDFEVGVGYENDLACALAIALTAVKRVEGVLDEPAAFVVAERLDAYAVVIRVYAWANQGASDFLKVRSEAIRQVKAAFEAAGVSMPEPIQNVRMLQPAPDPAAGGRAEAKAAAPSQEALREVSDTRPDDAITRKVQEIRAGSREDLLKEGAVEE